VAKRFAYDVVLMFVMQALQIHGGYGYIKEVSLERHVRDVRVHQILEGTNEIIARYYLGVASIINIEILWYASYRDQSARSQQKTGEYIGVITLNKKQKKKKKHKSFKRVKFLNGAVMTAWLGRNGAIDNSVVAVFADGAGDKVFCAGGPDGAGRRGGARGAGGPAAAPGGARGRARAGGAGRRRGAAGGAPGPGGWRVSCIQSIENVARSKSLPG